MTVQEQAIKALRAQFPRYPNALKKALKDLFKVLGLGDETLVEPSIAQVRKLLHTVKDADQVPNQVDSHTLRS